MMPINGQTPGPAEQQQAQPAFRRSTGAVASLARMFELNGAAERQQGAGGNNDSGGARQQWKRQRLASGTHPPLPSEWMSSPPLARGDCGADGSPAAPVERQLWEEKSDGGTAEAAREARLAKIRAKWVLLCCALFGRVHQCVHECSAGISGSTEMQQLRTLPNAPAPTNLQVWHQALLPGAGAAASGAAQPAGRERGGPRSGRL